MALSKRGLAERDVRGIVEAHYGDVFAYCRRHTSTAEEAQDATQDVFLRFVRSAPRYRDIGKPLAYLLTIARNVCTDMGRAHTRDHAELPCDEVLADPSTAPSLEEAEGRHDLARALAALRPEHREVLELRYDQELKVGEVARVLGVSRFAAARRIDAALRDLRSMMDREDGVGHGDWER